MPHRLFSVRSRFHPAHSLLGCGLRRIVRDPRQAETTFLLLLLTLALGLILAQFFVWNYLKEDILADPQGTVANSFWMGQASVFFLFVLTCVVGFRSAVRVSLTDTHLTLQQKKRTVTLAYEDITHFHSIPALRYYQEYQPYATTHAFMNRITKEVLVLHTQNRVFAIGLLPSDHQTLTSFLRNQLPDTPNHAIHARAY